MIMWIHPPQANPLVAPLDLLRAAQKVRGSNEREAWLYDANVEYYQTILTESHLRSELEWITGALSRLDAQPSLSESEHSGYQVWLRAAAAAPYVIQHIAQALATLREARRARSRADTVWALRVLTRAMEIVSARWYPTRITLNDLTLPYSSQSSAAAVAAAADAKLNPFLSWFGDDWVDRMLANDPSLILLWLSGDQQLIPALTLARRVRERRPVARIILTGPFVARYVKPLSANTKLFDWVSGLASNVEDGALQRLAGWSATEEPSEVPGVVWREPTTGRTAANALEPRFYPVPRSDGHAFPQSGHLSPGPVAALTVCPTETSGQIDSAAPQATARWAAALGVRALLLSDPILPAHALRALAEEWGHQEDPIRWGASAQAGPDLDVSTCRALAVSGCRFLNFALAGVSPRLLEEMGHYPDPAELKATWVRCRGAGLRVIISWTFGWPGATDADAGEALSFLLSERALVEDIVSLRAFRLEPDSAYLRDPTRWNITAVRRDPDRDLARHLDYDVSGKEARAAAQAQAKTWRQSLQAVYPLVPTLALPHHLFFESDSAVDRAPSQASLQGDWRGATFALAPERAWHLAHYRPEVAADSARAPSGTRTRTAHQWALAYDGQEDRFLVLAGQVIASLHACERETAVAAWIEQFGQAQRPQALTLLGDLSRAGLVRLSHPEKDRV